jgi:hypothetical protein
MKKQKQIDDLKKQIERMQERIDQLEANKVVYPLWVWLPQPYPVPYPVPYTPLPVPAPYTNPITIDWSPPIITISETIDGGINWKASAGVGGTADVRYSNGT